MARRRYISTDVSIDKRLNRLATEHGDFAALLYSWMIPHASDEATLNGDLDEFMATVIPMRRDRSPEDVRDALLAMCDAGLIAWVDETIYFPTEAFYRYQTYIKVENRRVGDIAEKRRETPRNAEGKEETPDLASTAQNAEKRRETPRNAVSFSSSSSVPPSVSSSVPPSVPVSITPSGRGARAARLGAPEGETPLPRPGKTVETVEWKEVMRSEYAARLEDFEETWQFILGSSYLKKRDDRRSYIEGQLKNAAKRWAEKGKTSGRNHHDEPSGTRVASKFAAYG